MFTQEDLNRGLSNYDLTRVRLAQLGVANEVHLIINILKATCAPDLWTGFEAKIVTPNFAVGQTAKPWGTCKLGIDLAGSTIELERGGARWHLQGTGSIPQIVQDAAIPAKEGLAQIDRLGQICDVLERFKLQADKGESKRPNVRLAGEIANVIQVFVAKCGITDLWNGIDAKIITPGYGDTPKDQNWGVCKIGVNLIHGTIDLEFKGDHWLVSGTEKVDAVIGLSELPSEGRKARITTLAQLGDILEKYRLPLVQTT